VPRHGATLQQLIFLKAVRFYRDFGRRSAFSKRTFFGGALLISQLCLCELKFLFEPINLLLLLKTVLADIQAVPASITPFRVASPISGSTCR
jgi:hypothetical protein